MNMPLNEAENAASTTEPLRLELEQCQRELELCRLRTGELEQAEALFAGEKRILEMIANGNPLPALLDALCRLVEELSSGCLCSILLLDSRSTRIFWDLSKADNSLINH